MRILFIGGTGIISSACAHLAIDRGYEVHLMVRGQTTRRQLPHGCRVHQVDARDLNAADAALGDLVFDAVVDFVAFEPVHVEKDLELFRGRTNQLVLISSASVYKKPVVGLPITESTPLSNPFWEYSRNKIACEQRLMDAYHEEGFPVTVVRPSHTYDETVLPFDPPGAGATILSRLDRGKPLIVHGDGTSLWTLTHHADFAVGLLGVLGHPAAIGDAFHITSDEVLPWNEVFLCVARAAGRAADLVHVPSDVIAREDPAWGAGLLGDKAHSVIFDNSKIKRLVPEFNATVPFWQGAREIVAYHRQHASMRQPDPVLDGLMDRLADRFG